MTESDEIEALARRVRLLEDRETIRNLIAAYGPAADSGEVAAAAALWSKTGVYDVGGMGLSVGRAAIEALLMGETHQSLIRDGAAHVLSPLHLDINGDDAVAIGYSCVFRRRDGGFVADRVSANRWELRREDGTWRVTRRVNRLLDGAAEARDLLRP